ncbi:MAG: TonB-dependent receptor plug domain-containing protein [Paracoccus sp. (in: a-proteobacteria)]|uniref:TonB-dependent receptor plug domain-containing protein n=1 Tax=Paracoccus sp. TaxID=267 RepID=UPI00391DA51D
MAYSPLPTAPRRGAFLTRLMCGVALAGLLADVAAAQGAPQVIMLDPITMRARDIDGNAADRATSKYVADAELDRARMGNLRDLFQGVASVSVGGGIPVAQKIFVNGVDMLNLNVTVDGVSQNNRIFHHVSANAFDPGLMKFVRVDAGIAAADAGPHALAGAVVMETVDADDILRDGATVGGAARLSYADNGRTFGRSLTLAGQHEGVEWLGYLKSATGDDYEVGGGDVLGGTAADLQSALLKLAYETPDGHRFVLSGQRMKDDALRRSRANIGDASGGRPYTPQRRYDTSRDTIALTYTNTQAQGMWDPTVSFGRSRVGIRVDQPDFAAIRRSDGTSENRNGKIENRFHLSDRDTVTVGVDHYDRRSTYSDDVIPALTERARNTGVYVQARLEPGDVISTSFGLRYDWQDFTGIDGTGRDVSGASGNASLAWQASDGLRLRGGVSSVFGGIVLEDNFLFDGFTGYEGLAASRARNATIGFDYDAGTLRLDGEMFVTQVDDARNVTRGAVRNFDFESRGFNLGATYDWQQGFLRASYSRSKVRVDDAPASSFAAQDYGTPLGGVFALEVQHGPAGSPFAFGGGIQAAQSYSHEGAADDERPLPGYGVVDLFVEYVPPQMSDLTIRGEVANLFDKRYADRATYGADFTSIAPLNEPGRTVSVTAALRF